MVIKRLKLKIQMWRTIRENKRLCEMYPFLIPWNRWSGKLITDCMNGEKGYWPGNPTEIPEYDWTYTELDAMPTGWRKAFGIQMCEELREALIEDDDLYRYRVVQCKEKYGSLRWYNNGTKIGSRVPDIERKYESMSVCTCIICGKPATKITTGWIEPYCDDCCPDERWMAIEEYYNKEDNKNGGNDISGNGEDGEVHRVGEQQGAGGNPADHQQPAGETEGA